MYIYIYIYVYTCIGIDEDEGMSSELEAAIATVEDRTFADIKIRLKMDICASPTIISPIPPASIVTSSSSINTIELFKESSSSKECTLTHKEPSAEPKSSQILIPLITPQFNHMNLLRFKTIREIPNIDYRWGQASSSVKVHMYMFIYVYMFIRYICICKYMYVYTYIYVCKHTYILTYIGIV
jgi:hypothetical protein